MGYQICNWEKYFFSWERKLKNTSFKIYKNNFFLYENIVIKKSNILISLIFKKSDLINLTFFSNTDLDLYEKSNYRYLMEKIDSNKNSIFEIDLSRISNEHPIIKENLTQYFSENFLSKIPIMEKIIRS